MSRQIALAPFAEKIHNCSYSWDGYSCPFLRSITARMPMRLFFSVGEPSGDIHAANLIRSLQHRRSDLQFVGFGGDRMEAAGCDLLYPLCRHAVMGVSRVLA